MCADILHCTVLAFSLVRPDFYGSICHVAAMAFKSTRDGAEAVNQSFHFKVP
jgi:hypothetical protein